MGECGLVRVGLAGQSVREVVPLSFPPSAFLTVTFIQTGHDTTEAHMACPQRTGRPQLGEVNRMVDAGQFGELQVLLADTGIYLFSMNEPDTVQCSWEHLYSYLKHLERVGKLR